MTRPSSSWAVRWRAFASRPAAFYAAARNIYLEEPHGRDGLWTRLSGLRPDSLFVWGRKDPLVPISFERHVREALPRAQHVELNCEHVPQLDRPKETHEALSRFLRGEPPTGRRRAAAAGRA
jgi:pimeloyl-ACP methyl ester carboxylesterase